MLKRSCLSWLCALVLLTANTWADGLGTIERPRNIQFTFPAFVDVVQPMKRPLGGRMPLLVWDLPLPADQRLLWSRQSGALRKAVDQLADRGIVPVVSPLSGGAVALAQTLQEAGQPVYLLIPKADLIESTAWRDCTVWATSPEGTRKSDVRRWPCLALADPKPGAQWVTRLLQPLRDANIRVAGVFYDDEALPHGYNGIYEAQMMSAECRSHYPASALESPQAFQQYAQTLRAELTRQIMVEPVHQLFPGALAANYNDSSSSAEQPFVNEFGTSIPPSPCGSDLAMPSCYANNIKLDAHQFPLTQDRADQVYFDTMLRSLSTSAYNARESHIGLMPYIGQAVYSNPSPALHFSLSRPLWREVLLHAWLRGSRGMYLFNLGTPGSGVTPAQSFQSVEDAREVYDDLLADREFLEKGEPMNLTYPQRLGQSPIWSGLRLPDRCLVHVSSPGKVAATVDIKAYDSLTVKLDAPVGGATYLINRAGDVKKQ